MKPKFEDEYVLGKGYPWGMTRGEKDWGIDKPIIRVVGLCDNARKLNFIELDFPQKLWSEKLPKYELVLRRVKE